MQRLVHSRDLVIALLSRELKVRYKNTVLGYGWSILHPLLFITVYLFAFKLVLRVQIEHYALFLVAGVFPWQAIQNSVTGSVSAFVSNASLIKRVYFPRHLLVVVCVLNDLLHLTLSLPVVAMVVVLHGTRPSVDAIWTIPVLLIIQFLITLGLSLTVAACNLFLRDLERLVGIAMLVWFYVSPIIYSEQMIPPSLRWLNVANPAAALMINWRHIVLGEPVDLVYLAASAAWGAASIAIGYGVYCRLNWRFAEVV